MKERPDGITIISIYHFVVAALCLLGICALLAIPAIVAAVGQQDHEARQALPVVAIVMAVGIGFIVLIGAAHAAVGWGLWQMQPWARIGAIVLAILGLFNVPIGTAIGAFILWYLFQPEGRQPFEEEPAAS